MQEYPHEWVHREYCLPDKIDKLGGAYVVRAGYNKAKANYHVGPRKMDCYSIHVIEMGSLLFNYGKKNVILGAGDLFCMYPDQIYEYERVYPGPSKESQLRMVWVAFDGQQAKNIVEQIGFMQNQPYIRKERDNDLIFSLHELVDTLENKLRGIHILPMLYSFFSLLIPKSEKTVVKKHWIQDGIEYMKYHFNDNISVSDVARFVGKHRSYFSAVFTKEMGISPIQYLKHLRMKEAKSQLLINQQITISELAQSLGYHEVYSFTRAFTEYYGLPPVKYRNTISEQ